MTQRDGMLRTHLLDAITDIESFTLAGRADCQGSVCSGLGCIALAAHSYRTNSAPPTHRRSAQSASSTR